MPSLETSRKSLAGRVTLPVVRLLAKTPLTPNAITWTGFIISLGAAALIVNRHFLAAGVVVLVAGAFDLLDGALARLTGRITRFGAILDSTLDRLSEAALLAGAAMGLRRRRLDRLHPGGRLGPGRLAPGQLYPRQDGGAGHRSARPAFSPGRRGWSLLALGLLLAQFDYALVAALALVTAFSYITAGQRLFSAWRQTRK